jgi:hypothetical protein
LLYSNSGCEFQINPGNWAASIGIQFGRASLRQST